MVKAIQFLTILFILSIPLILTGCAGHSSSNEKHKSTEKQSIITEKPFTVEVNETKKWRNISITIKQINVSYIKNKQKLEIVTAVKNESKNEVFGIGAGDFNLENNAGEVYKVAEGDNLGGEVEALKTLEGSMYFETTKSSKSFMLSYLQDGEKVLKWDLNIERKGK